MDIVCKKVDGIKCLDDQVEYTYSFEKADEIINALYFYGYIISRKFKDGKVYEKYIPNSDPLVKKYKELKAKFNTDLKKYLIHDHPEFREYLDEFIGRFNIIPEDYYTVIYFNIKGYITEEDELSSFKNRFDSEVVKPFLNEYKSRLTDVLELFDFESKIYRDYHGILSYFGKILFNLKTPD